MYPSIFYTLKCLIFSKLLKIANIGKKRYTKSLQVREFAVPLLSETGTRPDTKKLFDNIDSEEADCDSYRFLGLYAVCPYAIQKRQKGLPLAPTSQAKKVFNYPNYAKFS